MQIRWAWPPRTNQEPVLWSLYRRTGLLYLLRNADALSRRPYEDKEETHEKEFIDDSFEITNITEQKEVDVQEDESVEVEEKLEEWNLQEDDDERGESCVIQLDYQGISSDNQEQITDYVSKIDHLQKLQKRVSRFR